MESRHSVQSAAVVAFYDRRYIEEFNIYSAAYPDLLLASLPRTYAHGVHQGRVHSERICQKVDKKKP